MSFLLTLLLGLVLLAVWLYAAVMITRASLSLRSYRKDEELAKVYSQTFWCSVIIWTSIALAIIGIVLLYGTGVGEVISLGSAATGGAGGLLGVLVVLALVITCGVLSAIEARRLNVSSLRQELQVSQAYRYLLAATVASLSLAGLIIFGTLAIFIYRQYQKSHQRKQIADLLELNARL